MRKQNTKTTTPLEIRFRYLSSPTGREGGREGGREREREREISRPLDHTRQIPFMHSAQLEDSTNFYIDIEQSSRYFLHVVRSGVH